MAFRASIIFSLTVLACALPSGFSTLEKRLNNGVGVTPAMGWNNWNAFGGAGSNAANALATANAFVNLSLSQLGYKYVCIDDCWSEMSRDSEGNLQPDPTKWPNGIKAVTDQIHSMGLKFGLYGDSGTATCSGYPGSQGYETQDADQLAAWGVDYWKYDNCNTPSTGTSQTRYTTMSNALLSSGRTILYAMCNWGQNSVWTWGASVGNSWRVGGDITDAWSSVASIAASNAGIASYAGPGGFNDFDMLEVGNGGLTTAEERSHFGLWAISKSPLILGTDLTKISSASLVVITNADVIAINQDALGLAAAPFQPSGQPAPPSGSLYPYYSGKLSDGYVVGLIAVNGAATLSVNFSDVPGLGAGTYTWKEAYTGATGTGSSVSANLGNHDMAIFKITVPIACGGQSSSTTTSKGVSLSTTSTASSTTTASSPTTTASSLTTTPASSTSTSTSPAVTATSPGSAPHWGQCGGSGWTGPTVCASPYTCLESNPWYSQCL